MPESLAKYDAYFYKILLKLLTPKIYNLVPVSTSREISVSPTLQGSTLLWGLFELRSSIINENITKIFLIALKKLFFCC